MRERVARDEREELFFTYCVFQKRKDNDSFQKYFSVSLNLKFMLTGLFILEFLRLLLFNIERIGKNLFEIVTFVKNSKKLKKPLKLSNVSQLSSSVCFGC